MLPIRSCVDSLLGRGDRRTLGVNRMEGSSGLDSSLESSGAYMSATSTQTPLRSIIFISGEEISSEDELPLIIGLDSSRLELF